MTPSIKLTYFDIEGAAEPTRLALVLSGTAFEDERVKFPDWAALKPTTPYGQLPLMSIDNGPVRTQSGAMLRYVGSSFSQTLYPPDKIFDIEEAIGVVEDMSKSWQPSLSMGMRPEMSGYPVGFSNTEEGQKLVADLRQAWVRDKLPVHLTYLQDMIEKNGGKWLASAEEPTIADCMAVPFLRGFTRGHIDHVPTNCLETHPAIVEYVKRFCALEPIRGRYDSGLF
jgi:glutathione S-transferase